ncbi:MAG TPA: trypsin-like peptidase domain-containing protein [Longimicrobiales bacterium]|nr:trypsin-like peptidase domain-containing protein [Longimicrobiales bacterium]
MKSNSAKLLVFAPLVLSLAGCGRDNTAQAQSRGSLTQVREALGPVSTSLDTATAAQLSGAFRGAADRALPAVVQIRVTTAVERVQGNSRRFQLPFPIPGLPDDLDPNPRGGRGTGSGVIFDARGYILTNNHVVQNAASVRVVLVDGREFDGKVIGTDPNTDVAVIKIEPRAGERLSVAQIGNSDQLRVGDWVLALGSPLGLDFTVTAGIVSAKSRNINIMQSNTALEAFIQTDAAINPGNSGGPLVDLLGRVVGINTAIQSPTGYFAGAGFAIPIDLAQKVAGDLIKYGVVHRPRLGVEVGAITEADAEVYRLPSVAGAEITSVQEGLPAARAGLKMGDVVISLDGQAVRTATDFMVELAKKQPGDEVKLGIIRYGRRADATVKLGEFEVERDREPVVAARAPAQELLGFTAAMARERATNMRGDDRPARSGVVIAEINPLGPAAEVSLAEGLEIVSINGTPISSVADVERVASRLRPGDTVSLVTRGPNGDRIINYRTRR